METSEETPRDDTEENVMDQQDNTNQPTDDTEGHAFKSGRADAEAAEGDDTEGHGVRVRIADEESAEGGEDTEGHGFRGN
jgi:hypothetical protein